MRLIHLVLMASMFASGAWAATVEEEDVRMTSLANSKSLPEAVDFMTPAELEAIMLPIEEPIEALYTPIASRGPLVYVQVHIGSQRVQVSTPTGNQVYRVSTGRSGYATPRGCFGAKWLSKNHKSKKYDNAPMPNAIFFNGGIALHGTFAEKSLGRPASHGCVRLARNVAAWLFETVRHYGLNNTRICVN